MSFRVESPPLKIGGVYDSYSFTTDETGKISTVADHQSLGAALQQPQRGIGLNVLTVTSGNIGCPVSSADRRPSSS